MGSSRVTGSDQRQIQFVALMERYCHVLAWMLL